jgi:hypothetical protein
MSAYSWVSVWGRFDALGNTDVVFRGYSFTPERPATEQRPAIEQGAPPPEYAPRGGVGRAISNQRLTDGKVSVDIEFDGIDPFTTAEVVLDTDGDLADMLTIGLGANGFLASARHFTTFGRADRAVQNPAAPQKKWNVLRSLGNRETLQAKHAYHLEINIKGQFATVELDGVELGSGSLPFELSGKQLGLFCQSVTDIHFRNLTIETTQPQAFIVMQFEPPEYEELFKDVIVPVCEARKLKPFRSSQTYQPGLVISDIQRQIRESRVVIAEITPVNPNVYYEVGFADAIGKPVILIADGGKVEQLPFDVRSFRTIFYENTIGGKSKVEVTLTEFLKTIIR